MGSFCLTEGGTTEGSAPNEAELSSFLAGGGMSFAQKSIKASQFERCTRMVSRNQNTEASAGREC